MSVTFATGCRQSPPPVPKTIGEAPEPLGRAREAMDRRDYGLAVTLLREALARRPAEIEVHYRLAVATSHLDQSSEAGREFEWVVANGPTGAQEVQIARDWLVASRARARVPAPSGAPVNPEAPVQKAELAALAGRALGPDGAKARLQLFLKGQPGSPVKDEYHVLRTDQQGNFRFTNVAPGDYMITNVIAGPPAWRLRVSLTKGERLVLDLSPANQATVRDDFPESRS